MDIITAFEKLIAVVGVPYFAWDVTFFPIAFFLSSPVHDIDKKKSVQTSQIFQACPGVFLISFCRNL
jgi:hypothetical protein